MTGHILKHKVNHFVPLDLVYVDGLPTQRKKNTKKDIRLSCLKYQG